MAKNFGSVNALDDFHYFFMSVLCPYNAAPSSLKFSPALRHEKRYICPFHSDKTILNQNSRLDLVSNLKIIF